MNVILLNYLSILIWFFLSSVGSFLTDVIHNSRSERCKGGALMANNDFLDILFQVEVGYEQLSPDRMFSLDFVSPSNKTFKICKFSYLVNCSQARGDCTCKNISDQFNIKYHTLARLEYSNNTVVIDGASEPKRLPLIVSDVVSASLTVNNNDTADLSRSDTCNVTLSSKVGVKIILKFCVTGLHHPTLYIGYTGRHDKSGFGQCILLAPVYSRSMLYATFKYQDLCGRNRTIQCPFKDVGSPLEPEDSTLLTLISFIIAAVLLFVIASGLFHCFSKRPFKFQYGAGESAVSNIGQGDDQFEAQAEQSEVQDEQTRLSQQENQPNNSDTGGSSNDT